MNVLTTVAIDVVTPTAAWDVSSFLGNAKTQIQVWGGGLLLMLVGAVLLIWGAASRPARSCWPTSRAPANRKAGASSP